MESDADNIQPIIGKKPKSTMNRRIVFFAVAGLLILAGLIVVVSGSKKTDRMQSLSQSEPEQKTNSQQLLSVWGTVTEVKEFKEQTLSGRPEASLGEGAVLTLKSDSGKDYQVSVDGNTAISKNQAADEDGAEKELESKVSYKSIKIGDRIYLSSSVDLSSEALVPAGKVVGIKWFETVVPR